MQLRRRVAGEFKVLKTKELNGECRATFHVGTDYAQRTFRAIWPQQDNDHRRGKSGVHTVTPHP
jgi:hypothetical protein